MNEHQTTAWYKQFWPWFLIALPGSVVIASIATIIIATRNPDSVVIDDYYKAGLAINRDLSREQQAERLNIKSTLQLSQANGDVSIIVEAAEHARPQQLQLQLMHPTLSDRDQAIILQRSTDTAYSGSIAPLKPGTWNIIVESSSPSWRIQHRIEIEDSRSSYKIR